MPSKTKPPSKPKLDAYEAQRDLSAELLQSIREMKADQGRVVYSEAIEARKKTGLSQSQFAALLGVSVRTLQGWEQNNLAARQGLCSLSPKPIPLLCWLSSLNKSRAGRKKAALSLPKRCLPNPQTFRLDVDGGGGKTGRMNPSSSWLRLPHGQQSPEALHPPVFADAR